eukprot:scaffold4659_cov125-Isochrysis_galbana.AAC.8
MANNNLALFKRPRNIPTPSETVCASTAAARAPQAPPCTLDDRTCLHSTVNSIPEPPTLRRLKFCDVQRCLRVLSGALAPDTNNQKKAWGQTLPPSKNQSCSGRQTNVCTVARTPPPPTSPPHLLKFGSFTVFFRRVQHDA